MFGSGGIVQRRYFSLLIGLMADNGYATTTTALCSLCLAGYGMTIVALFQQTASKLGMSIGELLLVLKDRTLRKTATRLNSFFGTTIRHQGRGTEYVHLFCKLYDPMWFSELSLKENGDYACLLTCTLSRCEETNVDALNGVSVSERMRQDAIRIAQVLEETYTGVHADGESSDIVASAMQRERPVLHQANFVADMGQAYQHEDQQDLDFRDDLSI